MGGNLSSWKDVVPLVAGKQVGNITVVRHSMLLPKHPVRGHKTQRTFYRGQYDNTYVKKHCFGLTILSQISQKCQMGRKAVKIRLQVCYTCCEIYLCLVLPVGFCPSSEGSYFNEKCDFW